MKKIIYGKNAILSGIENKRIKQIFIQKNIQASFFNDIARTGLPIIKVSKKELIDLTGTQKHQGIAGLVKGKDFSNTQSLIDEHLLELPGARLLNKYVNIQKDAVFTEKKIIIILDHIVDPGNFGAIIRTAAFYNTLSIIITDKKQVGLTPVVEKVAEGGLNYVPVIQVSNIANTTDKLKEFDWWICSIENKGSTPLYSTTLPNKVAFVFGNEGKGIRRLILEKSDFILNLGKNPNITSLNVSVALGATLFYFRKL